MRRIAPCRALVRRSLLSLGLASFCSQALSVGAQDGASGSAELSAAATTEGTSSEDQRDAQLLRRSNSFYGPVGGVHVVEAGSGPAGSLRLGLMTDFFRQKDYLYDDDDVRVISGALSLSVTPIEHLEFSAAVSTRSLRLRGGNSHLLATDEPEVVQSFGDPYLDVKGYGEVAKGVTLGGDVMVSFLTSPPDEDFEYAGTSFGLRGNLSLDLRRMPAEVPLELRANFGYVFDDSAGIVESIEERRLSALRALGANNEATVAREYRHLARRHERLAYGVNRVDHASIALGLEAPLSFGKVGLHPLLEWELSVPVNRQDFDCSFARGADGAKIPGEDSCLADEGLDTWPQRILVGARLFPALAGFSILAAYEYSLAGATNFVRELAPAPPWRVTVAASYAIDLSPKQTIVVKEVERKVEVVAAPKPEGRVRGSVVEQGSTMPVREARVSFRGTELSALLSDESGRFVSYPLAPGAVHIELEADGYRPGGCSATIPAQGGDTDVKCELVALPRVGSVVSKVLDPAGAPIAGVRLSVVGQPDQRANTDMSGRAELPSLAPGDYQVRLEHASFLATATPVHVDVRKESALEVRLTPRPAKPAVTVEATQLKLRGGVSFVGDTAQIDPRSLPLLAEVADVLLSKPEIVQLEIQGHTDNKGVAEANVDLSRQRALAVREALVRAGVEGHRLLAQGYGGAKPVAPNITAGGRAKNRRIELRILERSNAPVSSPTGAPVAKPPAARPEAAATRPTAAPVATPAAKPSTAPATPARAARNPAAAGPAAAAVARPATLAKPAAASPTPAPAAGPGPVKPAPVAPAPPAERPAQIPGLTPAK